MESPLAVVVLFTLLFFFSGVSAMQLSRASHDPVRRMLWEKIKNVKHNRKVQKLGRFAVDEANKQYADFLQKDNKNAFPDSDRMDFFEVVEAKWRPFYGNRKYSLKIMTTKRNNTILGKCYALVYVGSSQAMLVSWRFEVIA